MDIEDSEETNLKKLYPFVNGKETPLPSCWNRNDKFPSLSLTQQNARVRVRGRGAQITAAIRSDSPIPPACGLYYFEVHIKDKGRQGCICIGLSQENAPLDRMPGWCENSFGYYGESGKIFAGSESGIPYGPTFSSGDVIGCGINFAENVCFYTKNGQNIGIAFRNLEGTFYPTVGMITAGEMVDANFGGRPFLYNVYDDIKEVQTRVQASIRHFALPSSKSEWLQRLVSDYLVHHGYAATAESFNNDHARQSLQEAKNRQDILNLVKSNHFDEAILKVQELYPRLFEQKPELLLALKCQEFLVTLIAFYDEQRSHHQSSNGACKVTTTGETVFNRSRISASPKSLADARPVSSSLRNSPMRIKSPRPFRRSASPASNEVVLNGCEKSGSSSPEYFDTATSMENGTKNSVCDGIGGDHSENGTHKATSCDKSVPSGECTGGSAILFMHNGLDGPSHDIDGDCSMTDLTCADEENGVCDGLAISDSRIERFVAHGRELFEMQMQLKQDGDGPVLKTCYEILRDAFNLIAFTDPTRGPKNVNFDPKRREYILSMLNGAMLDLQGSSPRSSLSTMYAHAQRLRIEMAKHGQGSAAFADVDRFLKE